jgi:hypothetical protein
LKGIVVMTRSSIYLRAIIAMLVAIPTYAFTAIIVYHVITSNHAGVELSLSNPFLLVLLFIFCLFAPSVFIIGMLLGFPLAIYAMVTQLRIMRALRDHDSIIVPPLSTQPSTDGALFASESLHIVRTRSARSLIREFTGELLGMLILFALFEVFLLVILPQQRTILWGAIINLNTSLLMPLTTWDWVTLLSPLFCMVFFIVTFIRQSFLSRFWSVVADDSGITLTTGRKRTNVKWNEIQGIAFHRPVFAPNHLDGQYLITTSENCSINFVIDPRPVSRDGAKTKFDYRDGYDRYVSDILRLFATMRVRSLVTFRYNSISGRLQQRVFEMAPLATLREESVYDAPVADTSLQPEVVPVTTLEDNIEVIPRLNWRPIIRNGVIFNAIILGLILTYAAQSGHLDLSHFSWNDVTRSLAGFNLIQIILTIIASSLFILALAGLVGSLGFLFAYSQQRKRFPGLVINDDGIVNTQRENNKAASAVFHWNNIRAWVLLPADDRQPYDTYVILHATFEKFFWRVSPTMQLAGRKVEGDRQAVFQERLREAHAVIAAKTGLPLRIYSPRTP